MQEFTLVGTSGHSLETLLELGDIVVIHLLDLFKGVVVFGEPVHIQLGLRVYQVQPLGQVLNGLHFIKDVGATDPQVVEDVLFVSRVFHMGQCLQ